MTTSINPEIVEVSNAESIRLDCNAAVDSSVSDAHKDLVEAFKMFDINGDGKISQVELGTILRSLGESPTDSELDQMIRDADENGDGEIDLVEFITLNSNPSSPSAASSSKTDDVGDVGGDTQDEVDAALQSAFDVFDSDRDGFISAGELHRVLSGLGDDRISIDDCRYMISCVDADGDELVDFKEFRSLMTRPLPTNGQSAQETAH